MLMVSNNCIKLILNDIGNRIVKTSANPYQKIVKSNVPNKRTPTPKS